jgi:hypothetical protein
VKTWISAGEVVMEPGNPEASSTPKTEADAYITPLIQKVGAPSIAQIEKLIGELQEAKDFLESEAERVQQEMVRYIQLIQMASASVEIISDTVSGWHQAGHPMRKFVSPGQAS